MSQVPSGSTNGRRNILIGIGLAAAGIVLVSHYALDFPGSGDKVVGTVAPAERYRAPQQIQQQDVALGNQDVTQLMQSEAFERLVKDPSFQALVRDEGFLALAQHPAAL